MITKATIPDWIRNNQNNKAIQILKWPKYASVPQIQYEGVACHIITVNLIVILKGFVVLESIFLVKFNCRLIATKYM
jgi:hypothetical protein